MSPIVYNINNATLKEKMASFDFDWTIVNPKEGKTFPSDVDDWEWLYPNIPEKIKEYYNNGYMIVIFTNQTKKWKHQQIKNVISLLEIPVFIVIATAKVTHKPNPVLFNVLIAPNNIDKDNSVDQLAFQITLEDETIRLFPSLTGKGSIIMENTVEGATPSYIIQEEFKLGTIDENSQNDIFETLDDNILDFTEGNPFGDAGMR